MGRLYARHILLAAVALISLVALSALAWNSRQVIDDLRSSDWLVKTNDLAEAAFRLNAATAMERGITAALLAADPKIRISGLPEMHDQRAVSHQRYADVLAIAKTLAKLRPHSNIDHQLHTLAHEHQIFLAARNAADMVFAGTDDDQAESKWIAAATRYIESVAALRRAAMSAFSQTDHPYRHNVFLKDVFYTAAEYAGRERAIVGAAIAANRPLSEEELSRLGRYRSIVDISLDKMAVQLDELDRPAINTAFEKMRRIFGGEYDQLRQRVYEASANHENYPVDALTWYLSATRAIGTILDLSATVSRYISADIASVRLHALHMGALLALTVFAVLAAFVIAYLAIYRRILTPLRTLQSAASWLSRGQLTRRIPPMRPDELGELGHTLEKMRQSVLADIKTRESDAREMRKLVRAIEQSSESVVITDKERRIEYVNPAFERRRGYSRREVIGKNVSMLQSGENQPELYAELNDALASDRIYTGILVNQRKNGALYFEELTITPLQDSAGHTTHYVATGRDVTERVQSQETLRKLSQAIEQSVSSIIITDRHGRIEYVNPQFTRTTGYAADEVLDRHFSLLKSERTPESTYRKLWRTISRGEVWEGELLNKKKNGDLYWDLVSISPVVDDDGNTTHFVAIQHDITRRKEMEQKLDQLAYYDELTGLPNRSLLQDRFTQTLAYARRHRRLSAILFLDLDRFKLINDSLGHSAGDGVLKIIAERLAQSARESDTVCRYGGDEFIVLLSELETPNEAGITAERMLAAVADPITVEQNEFRLTGSIGISIYPDDGADLEILLRNADAAMYRVKDESRNGYRFYTNDLNQQAMARLEVETRLRRALEQQEFTLHYQPQVELEQGRIIGMEALLRWSNPDLGSVSPAQFIPIAEETGLIVPIGEWVLATACRQLMQWRALGHSAVPIAVNVSARQLEQPNFTDSVAQIIETFGVPPSLIELEITESAVMNHPELMSEVLHQLKGLGVGLAMDDFGTGYSSLGHLRQFPFDKLKIDKSFVSNVTVDPNEAVIATTISAMAHSLRITVIAEGVETETQACYLRRNRCMQIQGYFFSPPLPAEKAEILLMEDRRLSLPHCQSEAAATPTILCVHQDPLVLDRLHTLLRRAGYTVLTATHPREALELMAGQAVRVVIYGQEAGDADGFDLHNRIEALHPESARILLEELSAELGAGARPEDLSTAKYDELLLDHVARHFSTPRARSAAG